MVAELTRQALVARLAAVEHRVWRMQRHRDKEIPLEKIPEDVMPHDTERAEAAVSELEALGFFPSPSSARCEHSAHGNSS